ncbi:MAG: hypothetical protein IV108_11975 [Burkholderiales bacterium]|nr:hypothetical protein [Burkholderiales bacterium]
MNDPKTWDEYLDLVHQAVYEIDEMRACIDEDAGDEDAEIYIQFIDPLDAQLRKLFDDMTSDRYEFQHDTDLPFMAIVKRYGRAIPFRTLLETINRTHRKGV